MLNLYEGSFYSEAKDAFYKELKRIAESGVRSLLIVPEQQTVLAEKEMAETLSDSAPISFEVTNFTRFANSVFRELGGVDKEYCDTAKSALIMWRTLTELSPTLAMTDGRREINYGMVERALKTTGESDGLAIGAAELLDAKEAANGEPGLQKKLDDLIKITTLYKKLLSERYSDVGEDVSEAVQKLRNSPTDFAVREIFIDGFISFTEPQIRLIELLMHLCNLHVHFSIPKAESNAFEYTEPVDTEKRLRSIAKNASCDIQLRRFEGVQKSTPLLSEICSLLWRTSGKIDNDCLQNCNSIHIYESATPYEACDFIISDIRRRVMLGSSYSDFAVIAGNIGDYEGILDSTAKRNGVPLFLSSKKDISSYEAIKLIYTALSVIFGGFSRSDVISYAKCGLSGISPEECDVFELYVEKWQIKGRMFTDPIVWNMNPDGYDSYTDENTASYLLRINDIKSRLLYPLTAFANEAEGAETVKDFAVALYRFIDRISLFDRLKLRVQELYAIRESEAAIENELLPKLISDSLDTLVSVNGDEKCTPDAFISQLKIVFSSSSVSKIPTFADSVTAGSAQNIRISGKRHVYMLGVNKGVLPSSVSDNSYFSDREKAILNSIGLPFKPDMLTKGARELYSFSRAFSYARESIDLIYYTKSFDYSSAKAADVIGRIREVTKNTVIPKRISEIGPRELIYSPSEALMMLGALDKSDYESVKAALNESGYGEIITIAERKAENDNLMLGDAIKAAVYENDLNLSQSKIDMYNTCPLAYFCRYDLRLDEGERAEFNARNIGSFIHATLENFFRICQESDILPAKTDTDMRTSLVKRSAEEYLLRLEKETENVTTRTKLLIDRLVKATMPIVDGLCDEFADSKYLPRFFELHIGGRNPESPEALVITDENGKRTVIRGSIDRVDTYKYGDDVYVRVIDYKTGHKAFSPADLKDGKNLQMFLYLKAVVDSKNKLFYDSMELGKNGRLIPAGVIYVKSDLTDVKISHASQLLEEDEVKKDQKRAGMILDDPISLGAMNSEYLPVRIGKNGYYKDSLDKIYTEEGWKTLSETVEDSVRKICRKMRSGNIYASPLLQKNYSPCNYCKFKPICRNAKIK